MTALHKSLHSDKGGAEAVFLEGGVLKVSFRIFLLQEVADRLAQYAVPLAVDEDYLLALPLRMRTHCLTDSVELKLQHVLILHARSGIHQ